MKKWTILLLLAVMLQLLASPVLAEETLIVTDAEAMADQTVFLTVSLPQAVVGDAVGIQYSYDSTLLQAMPKQCTWLRSGILQDFVSKRNSGAWAAAEPQDLSGEICVLAFRIRSDSFFKETAVTCTVVVKNGAEEVGEYAAQATVTMICNHDYGDWKENGILGHSRACGICGIQQTQSHNWDGGVITQKPGDPYINLQTFTCSDCGNQRVNEIYVGQSSTIPIITMPTQAMPTVPQIKPEATLPGAGNSGTQTVPQTTQGHDHDYSDETLPLSDAERTGNVILVLFLTAVIISGATWFVRKRK